jgi:membrane associated rhomboid family serine protease
MFQRMIDDFKASTGTAVRQTSLVAIAAFALFITLSFLCAAGFIVVLDKYGLVQACLAGAGLFFIVALIALSTYAIRKRQIEARAAARAKSAAPNLLADPMVVATGLQLVRAIGLKRLLPLLAVSGLALGFLASRNQASDETPAE